ncbi:hypothetical protein LCGC14_1865580, partial [marine sediment metagenome]
MTKLAYLLRASIILAIVAFVGGCKDASKPQGKSPGSARAGDVNVLLITLDTTRADRLGCYRYAKAQTPALDSLAAKGMRVDQAFTHVPLTLPAHGSLLTGMLPPEHGLHDNARGKLGPEPVCLAETLRSRGYRTAAFLASFVLAEQFGLRHLSSGDMLRAEKASGSELGRRLAYDGEIAFMDSQVQRLLDFLNARGLRERTLIVVAGDHGEAFGEHNENGHGPLVYQPTMQVPLLIALPGRVEPGRVDTRVVGLVDVAPTVLAMLGVKPPEGMTGRDLLQADPQLRPCYGESEFLLNSYGWAPLKSLTTRRWRYIQCPVPELYDRLADPAEARNLASVQPKVAAEMKSRLAEMLAGMKTREAAAVTVDPEALAALRALGYLGAATVQRVRTPPGERKDPKAMMGVFNACERASKLVDAKRYDEAVRLLAPAVRSSPESLPPRRTLIESYAHLGKYDSAVREAKAYLALDPADRDVLGVLGMALVGQGKHAEAVTVLRQGLRASSTTPGPAPQADPAKATRIRWSLGLAYGGLRKFPQAIEQFQIILRDQPKSYLAHYGLATVYAATGQDAQALLHARDAVKAVPDDSVRRMELGTLLVRLGRFQRALQQYVRAVQLAPNSPDARIALAAGLMAFPLMVRAIRLSIEAVDPKLEQAAATLGASRPWIFATVTLPLILPGVLAGAILAFAKAMGEFGATITFVSNIPGQTQTLPSAIYAFLQVPGGESAALRLVLISVGVSMAAVLASGSGRTFST